MSIYEIESDGTGSRVYGTGNIETSFDNGLCNGVDSLTCSMQHTQGSGVQMQAKEDSVSGDWLIGFRGRNYINTLPQGGGVTSRFEIFDHELLSFDYKTEGNGDRIYFYCASNGMLYKKNANTGVTTQLNLPSSTIKCTGRAIYYHAGRDSLIFLFEQNKLFGVAEYSAP